MCPPFVRRSSRPVYEADAQAVATYYAWKLKGAGQPEAWDAIARLKEYADIGAVFADSVLQGASPEDAVTAAFEAGARGYLVKHLTVDLGHYLGRVLQGERVCCPDGVHTRVARTQDT